jgi:hypothetical protein
VQGQDINQEGSMSLLPQGSFGGGPEGRPREPTTKRLIASVDPDIIVSENVLRRALEIGYKTFTPVYVIKGWQA